MDNYESGQIIVQYISRNEGTGSEQILEYLRNDLGLDATHFGISNIIDWLFTHEFLEGLKSGGPHSMFLKLTPWGEAQVLAGRSVKEAIMQKHQPSPPPVSQSNQFNGSVGQFMQGNNGTMNQTNITIDTGDLAPVLQVMREIGDTNTADAVERLNGSGDGKGALRLLVDRFTGKAVDAAATQTVTAAGNSEYASRILPAMMNLISNLPWF